MEKNQWRKLLRKNAENWAHKEQANLVDHLDEFLRTYSGLWGAYIPHQFEPNISRLFEHKKITWAFPQIMSGMKLRWLVPGNLGFSQGPFGISEPNLQDSIEVPLSDLVGVLIPGIGFDFQGVRIGRGKGYYDRTLQNCGPELLKVGVVWSCQLVDEIPNEDHDLQVDYIITEQGIRKVKKG